VEDKDPELASKFLKMTQENRFTLAV
jgi:hypothetical protein